ncbi:hypothetical protein HW115_05750 [Verrucomicrobiaceae bacterium N1E253]|uniref:Uncharacterized protein n=1 Tax=Oceaniferula marina TaxID=2748318 RepID=A0A851GLU3_9BACT|nr:hypothetical protein [Oceaniferula marina]NWK55104.1 hypothetical protein [Oceaniferula marina]
MTSIRFSHFRFSRGLFQSTLLTCLISTPLLGGDDPAPILPDASIPDWVPSVRLGYLHQFDTDLDDGGSFSVDRINLRLGINRVFDRERSIGLSLGYGLDAYDFSDLHPEPWSDIHRFSLSVPIRWAIDDQWKLFAIPTVRSSAESGAGFSDSITGGFFGGFSYAFGDHLRLGPGIGVLSQLEDSTSVFPILIINWKITDSLQLETGRGFGASRGPGLNLVWQASADWKITLGSRYEKLRFRLDDDTSNPDGIGEHRGIPVYLGASYATSRFSELSVYAGAQFSGEMTLENASGKRLSRSDHDTAAFAGIAWKYGF